MNIAVQRKYGTSSIITLFLVLGLLRLLPFNFYASILVGHEVVIDNKEGNAINFINYLCVAFFLVLLLVKLPKLRANWAELLPFAGLSLIYLLNLYFAPYVNFYWVMYQLLFIGIAGFLHLIISGKSQYYDRIIQNGAFTFFVMAWILFIIFLTVQLYSQFSVSYIIEEYNDSFVNSLNSFGVMKQYYGYTAGFLLMYSVFILDRKWVKLLIISLVTLTAFGIRSFLIGLFGAIIIHAFKSPLRLFWIVFITLIAVFFLWEDVMMNLLFDTRFYAYMNGFDIIRQFPFGVGLGGYHEYTEINNRDLFANLFNINAALDYVPNSPESDMVHIFGSLGFVLGLIHLIIQLRLIVLGILQQAKMASFEKCMFYYFVFMTFFGLSEDTIFTVSYWIFFGIASGIVESLRKRGIND